MLCVCVCTQWLSCVQLYATPWTVSHQALCPWNFPGKNTGVDCWKHWGRGRRSQLWLHCWRHSYWETGDEQIRKNLRVVRTLKLALVVKNLPACQCRRHKRTGFSPEWGGSPGGEHGNALQYLLGESHRQSQATVYGVAKSRKQLNMHARAWTLKRLKWWKGCVLETAWVDLYIRMIWDVFWGRCI